MGPNLKNMADFKRSLAGGETATIVEAGYPHKYAGVPRTAPDFTEGKKVIKFEGGSRMDLGKVSEWRFEGNRATWTDPYDERNFVTYELGLPDERRPETDYWFVVFTPTESGYVRQGDPKDFRSDKRPNEIAATIQPFMSDQDVLYVRRFGPAPVQWAWKLIDGSLHSLQVSKFRNAVNNGETL